jgi:hypothetical protein
VARACGGRASRAGMLVTHRPGAHAVATGRAVAGARRVSLSNGFVGNTGGDSCGGHRSSGRRFATELNGSLEHAAAAIPAGGSCGGDGSGSR